jgi:CubicO group peptidase (beta-lactamase class C family)
MRTTPNATLTLSLLFALLAPQAGAQATLAAPMRARIDSAVHEVLTSTGAPSASIAVVQGSQVVYAQAYGMARLAPAKPATVDMRYSIGSISKQFTATAILLLAEQNKLSLDDKVAKYVPQLTRGNEVTIRQVLSMTSGYQDYWPQDYVMPPMLKAVTAQQIVDGWARKPLDFDPGVKWQYSNTNYVIAGMIVEKVSGMPLLDFLKARVFTPLHMTTITNTDEAALGANDPAGYVRNALAPVRPAPKEGKGWMFAAGELAMTAHDLALWDISTINQTVLKPASYHTMQTEVLLNGGAGSHYGLGVSVNMISGRRQISHGGEVSGYTARNEVYPDDRAAIVVLTNLDATGASAQIATQIAGVMFAATTDADAPKALAEVKSIFADLQHGQITRTLLTSNLSAYFSAEALADFQSSLGPLGEPAEFVQTGQSLRGGMVFRGYRIRTGKKTMNLTTYWLPDGKLEQYIVASVE